MKPEQLHSRLIDLSEDMDDPFADDRSGEELFDYLMGQVIQGLIEDGKEETAALMLSCRMTLECQKSASGNRLLTTIHGPVSIMRRLQERTQYYDPIGNSSFLNMQLEEFYSVLSLVVGPKIRMQTSEYTRFQAEIVNLPTEWRTELLEIVRKQGTTNQGLVKGKEPTHSLMYQNLRFRSQSEIKIAQALDRHSVMYFANCTARINQGQDRVNREPDFVVCHNGKWGAIEVDGEPFHPPTRTVHDHERDRLFQKHGLMCIEHYDANRCFQEPEQVVTEFLELLDRSSQHGCVSAVQ